MSEQNEISYLVAHENQAFLNKHMSTSHVQTQQNHHFI